MLLQMAEKFHFNTIPLFCPDFEVWHDVYDTNKGGVCDISLSIEKTSQPHSGTDHARQHFTIRQCNVMST